ncbi:MAG: chloride channel protein [Planctomycetota bacterium]|nr:MAG: chloride channel protein [Planctomycetota bacterium]
MSPQPHTNRLTDLLKSQDSFLIGVGALIGVLTGAGAIGFNEALHWFEEIVHGLQVGQGPGSATLWLVLAPAIGMLLTGVLVYLFASEAKGHGVPQVMAALIKRGGVIPLRIGIVKVIASILTVGSGGSAGTEGPIVQIGAVAGSVVGQKLGVTRQQLMTMVGCGAAAGISSIFNAPIAGVFFVLEILLRDFSIKTFGPIVISSVFSSVTTHAWLERNAAIFTTGEMLREAPFHVVELPSYVLLGVVCGLVAVGFNRVLHLAEDVYDAIRLHPVIKPVTGAVILGALGIGTLMLVRSAGATESAAEIPPIYGNGYSTIRALLDPASYSAGAAGLPVVTYLLLALVALKILATSVTLASGGSGGVFAPSLYLGAVTGAAVGHLLNQWHLLPSEATPATYALVGMAAVVAASTHAPLTAILILFELTRNYYVILPIMLAAIFATAVSQWLNRDSIYTAKLRREGVLIGTSRDITLLRRIAVSSVVRTPLPPEPIYASDPLSKLITLHASYNVPDFPVVDESGKYIGMVTGADIRTALIDREAIPLLLVAELLRTDLPTVTVDETLDSVLNKFAAHDVASLCLLDPASPDRPLALISRSKVMKRYQEALEQE